MHNKVVVTGAAGFIGSNLCEGLLERNYLVRGIDNLSMGNLDNLEDCTNSERFEFVEEDVRNNEKMNELCADSDVIVHLAAYKIPRYGNATDTLLINHQGTKNILDAARQGSKKVVLASTSDVYGKNPNLPFSEDSDLVIGPSTVSRWLSTLDLGYNHLVSTNQNVLDYLATYDPDWQSTQTVSVIPLPLVVSVS